MAEIMLSILARQCLPTRIIDCFVWEVMSDPQQKHIGQYLIGKLLGFFRSMANVG
jgi:hypothetical protein